MLHRSCPLLADEISDLFVDRDQRLSLHLVIDVAQVGGTFGIGHDALGWQASARH